MATHITIGDISPRIQYTGNGTNVAFTYPFPIFKDADMEVFEDATIKTLSTDYTVTGVGNSSGGTVTFITAPANGVVVTLRRNVTIERTSDFQESGEFRAKVINDELDTITAVQQQLADDINRSLRLSATDTTASLTLPDKAARASKYLAFDANGDPAASDATGPTGPTGPAGNDGKYTALGNGLEEETASKIRVKAGTGIVADATGVNVDVGSTNGKIAQVGAGDKLPAAIIPAVADNTARANIALNSFRIAVNGGLSVQNMVDGVIDEFTDQTGVDTVTSANETYDAAGNLFTNHTPLTEYTSLTSTMLSQLGLVLFSASALVDDVTTGSAGFHTDTSAAGSYLQIDLGAGNDQAFTKWEFFVGGGVVAVWDIEYSDDAISWTKAATGLDMSGLLDGQSNSIPWASAGAHRYWRSLKTNAASGGSYHNEVRVYIGGTIENMTLVSNATTALAQPDEGFAVIWQEDVDAVALNTDLKAYASRDGGTTWTQVVLGEEAILGTGRILTGSASILAQPAGTAMKWKIETLNAKEQKLHGVGLEWS